MKQLSKETTIGGLVIFFGLLFTQIGYLFDADPLTNADWGLIAAALGALWTGWRARDNNKSSEDVGAKK